MVEVRARGASEDALAKRDEIAPDNRTLDVLPSVSLARDVDDEPLDVVKQMQGLTRRRMAERAIAEAEGRAVTEYKRLLDRVAALAQALGRARDLPTVFGAVCDFALMSTPSAGVFISLYDAERRVRTAVFGFLAGEVIDVSGLPPMPMSGSPQSRAVSSGKVVVEDDYRAAVAGKPVVNIELDRDPRLPQSALAAPMLFMGRVLGAVEIQSYDRGAFDEGHVTAIRMAANLAANAVENVRLIAAEADKAERLRQAQRMEAVGRLAGGVAHDFNNLLTVISGYSDIALGRLRPGDPLHDDIEEIKAAGERAASLTRQLLAFSRKQVLQPKVFDLNAVLHGLDRMLGRLIGEDVEIVTVREAGLWAIEADPSQIEQVLLNLAVNARDAMPRGGTLSIATANVELEEGDPGCSDPSHRGDFVELRVGDTGHGMDEATRARVFEPFFTTKEQGKGTGLGLATVYGIVKQSGGCVSVESELSQGAVFVIHLPRATGEGEEVTAVTADVEYGRGTATVLLVEDERALRRLARVVLESSGYRVLEASNGAEALGACEEHQGPIDLVITDVVMPGMSGPDLVERLLPTRPGTKVLYMSGYPDDRLGSRGGLGGRTVLMQKPFTPDDLTRAVGRVLEGA